MEKAADKAAASDLKINKTYKTFKTYKNAADKAADKAAT